MQKPYVSTHSEKPKEEEKHLTLVYLNTQSVSSTSDEFYVTLQQNLSDIIILGNKTMCQQ